MSSSARDERGSSILEAALIIPVLLLFVVMVIAASRVVVAHNSVSAAAGAAARAASLERGAGAATAAGQNVATSTLAGSYCTPVVSVSGDFDAPVGTSATAKATVSCQVSLSDLLLPGLPGSVTISSSGTSVIDRYRGR